jgi:hypothetical protein
MRRKQIQIVFIIGFLLLNSLVNGSKIVVVHACTNFKIRDDETIFFGNSEDHSFKQISDTFITFVPQGQTWYDGSELEYGAAVVGYANGSGNSWVQGGLNERGHAFDLTSVPYTEPNLHGERPQNLVPEIFCCETIEEVIEYKNTHGVYQQEGGVQSFYVDKTGESVVFNIGEDGEFQFHRSNESFQLATNFYFENPSRRNPGSNAIRRYEAAKQELDVIIATSEVSVESLKLVLDVVHFEGPAVNTLYSNIFDIINGDIYLYFFHQFGEVVKLNLEEELAKGRHTIRISDLFTQETVDGAFDEYHEFPYIIRVLPTDLLILFTTMILDATLFITLVFVVGKKSFQGTSGTKNEPGKNAKEKGLSKGLYLQIIVSLAVIWSLLSFPMIYWNHKGEWWPFFDLPILNWPLQPFYANHNVFLLASLLGLFAVAFILSSLEKREVSIQFVRRVFELGIENRLKNAIVLGAPILISAFYLIMETLNIIHNVDWLMFAIMYPMMVVLLTILVLFAENNGNTTTDLPQAISKTDLIKTGIFMILTWGLWFIPIFLTGITDHMYVLLLVNLLLSIIVLTLFKFSHGQI